jgi:TonB family protein
MGKTKTNLAVFACLLATVLGCRFFEGKPAEISDAQKTAITRERLLERLSKKGVKQEATRSTQNSNINALFLEFDGANNRFKLNRDSLGPFSALLAKLIEIRRDRESRGLFAEGTNEVYKKITFPASPELIGEYNADGIFIEDFEKLVDDLKKDGFDQLELTFIEPVIVAESKPTGTTSDSPATARTESPNSNSKSPNTISGGVVNGKASNLVKPEYPPAARAVRASGSVNVEVLIDEKGNVVSATAVTGHPLLRQAAVKAAKESKFSPMLLGGQPVKVKGIIVFNFELR